MDTATTTPSNVYGAFYLGLIARGLIYNDVINNYKYVGGSQGRHRKYFELINKTNPLTRPPHTDKCICGHFIKENCYITDGNGKVLVLGNSCIKRFVKKSGRTCETCGEPHKNRKINRCNKCRPC